MKSFSAILLIVSLTAIVMWNQVQGVPSVVPAEQHDAPQNSDTKELCCCCCGVCMDCSKDGNLSNSSSLNVPSLNRSPLGAQDDHKRFSLIPESEVAKDAKGICCCCCGYCLGCD